MVSVTGSTESGKHIMRAGAESIKRVHLELGGKAPFIVYEDANIEAAANGAVVGGYVNCGQDCTAATRIYVQESVYDTFMASFLDKVKQIRVGDPSNEHTDMGPLISATQRKPWRALSSGSARARTSSPVASVPRRWFREGLLLRADRHRPGPQRCRDCAERGIRPGRGRLPFQDRGRGAGKGQRRRVRPGLLRLEHRHLQGHACQRAPSSSAPSGSTTTCR